MRLRTAALVLAVVAVPAVAAGAISGGLVQPTTRLTLTRGGAAPETTDARTLLGGGVKIGATTSAVGGEKYQVGTSRELLPFTLKTAFRVAASQTVSCDLSPAVANIGPVEARVARVPAPSASNEIAYRPGAITYLPVRFTLAHRKGDTSMADWVRATLAGKGTRRAVTIAIGTPGAPFRRIVLRDAFPVAYTTIEYDQGTSREVIELLPQRLEVLATADTFGLAWLDATFRGQAPTAQLNVALLEGQATLRTLTYTSAFVSGYRAEGLDPTAPAPSETLEVQPGPGSTPL